MFRSYDRRKRAVRILLECFLFVLARACLSLTEACFEGLKVIVKTRHSSRMRTACFSGHLGGGGVGCVLPASAGGEEGVFCLGGRVCVCPGGVCPGASA